MEEDAPDAIALPHPDDTTRYDVFCLKQTLLVTASETAFTAAGYPRRERRGGCHGRVNPDAAIDAVMRDLSNASVDATMGLNSLHPVNRWNRKDSRNRTIHLTHSKRVSRTTAEELQQTCPSTHSH